MRQPIHLGSGSCLFKPAPQDGLNKGPCKASTGYAAVEVMTPDGPLELPEQLQDGTGCIQKPHSCCLCIMMLRVGRARKYLSCHSAVKHPGLNAGAQAFKKLMQPYQLSEMHDPHACHYHQMLQWRSQAAGSIHQTTCRTTAAGSESGHGRQCASPQWSLPMPPFPCRTKAHQSDLHRSNQARNFPIGREAHADMQHRRCVMSRGGCTSSQEHLEHQHAHTNMSTHKPHNSRGAPCSDISRCNAVKGGMLLPLATGLRTSCPSD